MLTVIIKKYLEAVVREKEDNNYSAVFIWQARPIEKGTEFRFSFLLRIWGWILYNKNGTLNLIVGDIL